MPAFDGLQQQLPNEEAISWLTHVLTVIETLDASAYAELMTDDVELRLHEGAVLHGRDEVARTLGAAWTGISRIEHHELNVWGDSHQVVHEARIVIDTSEGTTIVSHGTSWLNRNDDGRITSARVYS